MEKKYIDGLLIIGVSFLIFVFFFSCKKDDNDTKDVTKGPVATTNEATNVGQGWATLNGTVNPNNSITVAYFEYDTATLFNNKIEAVPDTINDHNITTVKAQLTGLLPGTTYRFRLVAINSEGTSTGSEKTFTTTTPVHFEINFNPDITYGTVTDINGNIYRTVNIGTQEWMAENLRVEKLNDGTAIQFLPDASSWSSTESGLPAYSWYNNDSIGYGALYNWYAVSTGKLCPVGWHIATDEEWTILTDYLGGQELAGGKLKEKGTAHWQEPNTGASNESGFSALPAGYRHFSGYFNGIGKYGYWWTSTESSENEAFLRTMSYGFPNIDRSSSSKKSGMTIRCVKDN